MIYLINIVKLFHFFVGEYFGSELLTILEFLGDEIQSIIC